MAEELANTAKGQILAQPDVAALAHSGTDSQTVLRLLQ
jgi:flagellin-like hook-associated protein FlgL